MVKKIFSNKFDPQIIGTEAIKVDNEMIHQEVISKPFVKYLTIQITDEENQLFLNCFKNSTFLLYFEYPLFIVDVLPQKHAGNFYPKS
jgi:hypothetical protein